MPTAVLHTIAQRELSDEHRGDMISATALSGCPRKLKLERTTDYFEEPKKLYFATRGALIHGFLECKDLANVTTEKRVYKTVPACDEWPTPWTISGRIDFYDHARKRLEDIKTMSDNGLYVIFNGGAKQEHVWQLNVYRWLLNGGNLGAPDGPIVFWPVDSMVLHYTLMNRVISTGRRHREVSRMSIEPNFGKPYRCEVAGSRKSQAVGWGKTKQWTVDIDLPAVQIKPMDHVLKHIQKEGPIRLKGFAMPEHMPHGVVDDKDKNWECGWCAVKPACDKIQQADAVVEQMAKGYTCGGYKAA